MLKEIFLPSENPDITQSLVVILMAISSGVFLGRLRLGKVSLGVSAVMFSGLLLGHFGYRISPDILVFIRDFGLIFFVYAIGIQVGPSFFSSFKREGLRLNALAIGTVLLGGGIAIGIFYWTDTGIENVVGLMSGSVTNTPGLGAAKTALQEVHNLYPDKTFGDPAIAYAITYPMGIIGIIGIILISKILLRIDLQKETRLLQRKSAGDQELTHRKCRILNTEVEDKSIADMLEHLGFTDLVISRLKHSGTKTVIAPSTSTLIQLRDVVMVVGNPLRVAAFIEKAGKESSDLFIEAEEDILTKTIFVTNRSATHKKLSELHLLQQYNLKVTRVYRSGKELLAYPDLVLFYGDKLRVVGDKQAIDAAEKSIGNAEKRLLDPDFLSLFGGLIIGIILGSIPIFIPSLPVPLKLGFAAGPLLAALFISRFGGIGVIHSYLNVGAIHFMKDLGVCLFFTAVGVHAGEHFYEYFIRYNGWSWIFYGSFITIIPLIFMVIIGRFVLKMNFFHLAGLMSGTYTDPAALAFSNQYLDSDQPTQTYATVYPLVTIFRILVAQLLILLLFA